jgi:PDZ domain
MPVRFRLLIVQSILLAVVQCSAQDKPIAEISGAYQYDHLSLSTSGASATLNLSRGWDGSVNVPILRWFDVVGDVSRVWRSYSCSGCGASATVSVLTYGGGPQLSYRNSPYVQPFARFILGSAHSSFGGSVSNLSVSASVNSFFVAPGSGVDIRIAHNLWLRVGADWLHTSKDGVTVNGVRVLGGIKFTFGGARPSSASPSSQSSEPVQTSARMKISALGILAAVGQQQGAEIIEVSPNGVAALGALHPGDVINAVDGKAVRTPVELAAELSSRKVGDKVRLGFSIRGQWQSETILTLGESQ